MESGRLQPALQSTFFWGCIAMVAAIVLAVVAAMIHDIRWVLIFAWPFAIFAAWEFARICSTKKSVVLSAAGIAIVITGVLLGWLYFALAPTKIAIDSVPDAPASKVAQAFELARIPQLGQPLQPIEETDAVYQAAHEHAMVVSLLPMLDVYIFPNDRTKKAIRHHTATFLDGREWFDDAFLRALFHPPKDKKPPESRVAELWSQNPDQWKWIGWREWSCPFALEKFYYQKFEKGIIFGVLPTSETLGSSQIFAFANTGDWNSTGTELVSAPGCNENTAKVNGIPIHGRFVK